MLPLLILAAMIGCIPGSIAHRKGHDFLSWWIFGGLLFVVALPMAIVLKPDEVALEERRLATGACRRCPTCAELIRGQARTCSHCGAAQIEARSVAHDPEDAALQARWDAFASRSSSRLGGA